MKKVRYFQQSFQKKSFDKHFGGFSSENQVFHDPQKRKYCFSCPQKYMFTTEFRTRNRPVNLLTGEPSKFYKKQKQFWNSSVRQNKTMTPESRNEKDTGDMKTTGHVQYRRCVEHVCLADVVHFVV
jgi:hypothetical protein